MIRVVTQGKPGTAMMGFSAVLSATDIEAVVDFVRVEFMLNKRANTKYHTVENGWPEHERYRIAFPFALNEIALDTPWEELTAEQQQGKHLFMSACVTCHDRARVQAEGEIWESRPLSYPRNNYSHKQQKTDSVSGATPYAVHDIAPVIDSLSAEEKLGESLFQENCAFCHAADGTGKNWIGSFLEPSARDLTSKPMKTVDEQKLVNIISDGLPGTTMSAWKAVLSEAQIRAIAKYVLRAFIHTEPAPDRQG